MTNRFLSHSLVYLISEGLVKSSLFIITPIIINFYSVSVYGKLSLYLAYLPFFTFLFDLGGRTSIKRFILEDEKSINKFIFSLTILAVINSIFYFFVLFFIRADSLFFFVGLNSFLFVIIEFHLNKFQLENNALKYNLFYFLRNSLPFLGFALLVFLVKPELEQFYFLQSAIFIFITIALFVSSKHLLASFLQIQSYIKYSLKFSLPLLVAPLSVIILNVSDRYIIEYFLGEEEVGYYSLAYNVSSIFLLGIIAVSKPWQSFILNALKNEEYLTIKSNARKYFIMAVLGAIILVLLRDYIIVFLSNESFLIVSNLIPIILVGHFFYFLYMIHSNIAFYHKEIFFFVLPAVVAALLNVMLNIILIPQYGYEAAAYTTSISYLVEFLVIYLVCKYKFKFSLW